MKSTKVCSPRFALPRGKKTDALRVLRIRFGYLRIYARCNRNSSHVHWNLTPRVSRSSYAQTDHDHCLTGLIPIDSAYLQREWKSIVVLVGPIMAIAWTICAGLIQAFIPGLTFVRTPHLQIANDF